MVYRGLFFWLVLIACTFAAGAAERPPIPVTPAPASVARLSGSFTIDANTPIRVHGGAHAEAVAQYFKDSLARAQSLQLQWAAVAGADEDEDEAIRFMLSEAAAGGDPESYRLEITSDGVTLEASDARGLFYGATSLLQLLISARKDGDIKMPALRIADAPRLRWRGLLLDSARQYQSVDFIKRFIDAMAFHKLNVLHWHLSDDRAWRLEILKYPKLTAASAGGFYTQRQVRELVQYAAARNVTIVPGLEMPGHAAAAVAAYPQFGAGPGFFNIDEPTFRFFDDVFAEVGALFPGKHVHLGFSDVPKEKWAAVPRVQERMQELDLANHHRLHRYFTQRIGQLLAQRGRQMVGWDAVLSGAPADAVVTTARGLDGALTGVASGHDVVVSSAAVLDLDHAQGAAEAGMSSSGAFISLADIYKFDPAPAALSEQDRTRLVGVQANLWTGTVMSEEQLERLVFPRAAAVAEIGWSVPERMQWPEFQQRLVALMASYASLGIRYSDTVFRIQPIQRGAARGRVAVELARQAPLGEIRYTLNGSEPTARSPVYTDVLDLPVPTTLRATAFYNGQPLAEVMTMQLDAGTVAQRP